MGRFCVQPEEDNERGLARAEKNRACQELRKRDVLGLNECVVRAVKEETAIRKFVEDPEASPIPIDLAVL